MTTYRGRRAATIDNGTLRVTVLVEGGHLAEIRDLATGVNPLWTPDWPSIEPSTYRADGDAIYGGNAESSLLAELRTMTAVRHLTAVEAARKFLLDIRGVSGAEQPRKRPQAVRPPTHQLQTGS